MQQKLSQFSAKDLCNCLEKLGFEKCDAGRHQHKYKHPTQKTKSRRPFFLFPDNLRKDKQFQKALIRDLINLWGYTEEEVIGALK